MPATDYQGSFLGRISIRRNQVVSMDNNHEQELEDLDIFQKNISDRFLDLMVPNTPESSSSTTTPHSLSSCSFLSIDWTRKLLDIFLCCEAEFKAVLMAGREQSILAKPPLDRLIPDLHDRCLKALDICNAVMNGVDNIKHCQKLAEIVVSALSVRPLGEGQIRRAKKTLTTLMNFMSFIEEKEGNSSGTHKLTERNWSFGKRGTNKDRSTSRSGQFRSFSWGVSKNWSAAKQIQAMASNLVPPRGGGDSSRLGFPVHVISVVVLVVMWILVAVVPCQDRRGLAPHLAAVPKQAAWAHSISALHETIGEEWKKREKKGSCGLLEELVRMEKLGQSLIEFTDAFSFPGEAEKVEEMAVQVAELAEICRRMEEGLGPLQQQIREVFHRIVRSRAEVHDALDPSSKLPPPAMY